MKKVNIYIKDQKELYFDNAYIGVLPHCRDNKYNLKNHSKEHYATLNFIDFIDEENCKGGFCTMQDYEDLQEQNKTLKAEIYNHKDAYEFLNRQTNNYDNENKKLRQTIKNLEKLINDNDGKEIERLKEEIDLLHEDLKYYYDKTDELADKIKELEKQNIEEIIKKSDYKKGKEIVKLREEINLLTRQSNSYYSKNKQEHKVNKELKNEIKGLKKQIDNDDDDYNNLYGKTVKLKDENEKLNKDMKYYKRKYEGMTELLKDKHKERTTLKEKYNNLNDKYITTKEALKNAYEDNSKLIKMMFENNYQTFANNQFFEKVNKVNVDSVQKMKKALFNKNSFECEEEPNP